MDAIASLEWVQQYISNFGGDPDDVTIFGQSSGGSVVISLYAISSAAGLFNRGISMSGSSNFSMDLSAAEGQNAPIVARFCSDVDQSDHAAVVDCMRNAEAKNVTDAYPDSWWDADDSNFGIPGPSRAGNNQSGLIIVDGDLITMPVIDAIAAGVNDVPLMLGNTQYEPDYAPYEYVRNYSTVELFSGYLNWHFREWGDTFGVDIWDEFYQEEWELGGPQLVYDGMSTDAKGFCGTRHLAQVAADSEDFTSNVYVFSFQQWPSHPFPAYVSWNATHSYHSIGLDAATFSWGAYKYWGALYYEARAADEGFGELIREHWSSFVSSDEPMDSWTAFSDDNGYGVALLGSGPNWAVDYNKTEMASHYKKSECQFYRDNYIWQTFWWTN